MRCLVKKQYQTKGDMNNHQPYLKAAWWMARGISIAGDIRLRTRNVSRFEGLEFEENSERGGQKRARRGKVMP